jgi:hypothetical protein
MSAFDAKQINRPEATYRRRAAAVTVLTGTSAYVVTAAMAGSPSGGSNTAPGVFTTSPMNKAVLIRSLTGRALEKADGTRIYGRITFAAAVFTLTLFVSDGAGGETAYAPIAGDGLNNVALDIVYTEVVSFAAKLASEAVNGLDGLDDVALDVNSHQPQVDVWAAAPFAPPTAAQTSFPLSQTPKFAAMIVSINGQVQTPTLDYTLAGSTVTYLARSFPIGITDEVIIKYDR